MGEGAAEHRAGILAGRNVFRPLAGWLGPESPHARIPAAWIEAREILCHRKWSPVTMAALRVARQAVAEAGWSRGDLSDAALVLGTSRGNAAGWLAPWPGRRPFRLMAASNTIHSEPASAISIELGMHGPSHVLASGCAAGLDALCLAAMMLSCGAAARALVVAVDLPLVPLLLDNYAASGLLAREAECDPYSPRSAGFVPAEGAAAVALETSGSPALSQALPRLLFHAGNSDGCDPVGVPRDGGRIPHLIRAAIDRVGPPAALCPHATGTAVQAVAEPAAFARALPENQPKPTLHLLKPYLGHSIGASGLLEAAVCIAFIQHRQLPPNRPGLHAPAGFCLPEQPHPASGPLFKLSHGMGGHNALVALDAG